MSTTPPTPMPHDSSATQYLLGQIHSMVVALKEGQDLQNQRFDKLDSRMDTMDGRLRAVEQRTAVVGAVSGGAMGVGMALLVEALKQWVKRGGPSP